jgi:hypothetical protein
MLDHRVHDQTAHLNKNVNDLLLIMKNSADCYGDEITNLWYMCDNQPPPPPTPPLFYIYYILTYKCLNL